LRSTAEVPIAALDGKSGERPAENLVFTAFNVVVTGEDEHSTGSFFTPAPRRNWGTPEL
jgi:hypothetical protein